MPADQRAVVDDDLREMMIARVMQRDALSQSEAARVVWSLAPHQLTLLELECRVGRQPAFMADYDPYQRTN